MVRAPFVDGSCACVWCWCCRAPAALVEQCLRDKKNGALISIERRACAQHGPSAARRSKGNPCPNMLCNCKNPPTDPHPIHSTIRHPHNREPSRISHSFKPSSQPADKTHHTSNPYLQNGCAMQQPAAAAASHEVIQKIWGRRAQKRETNHFVAENQYKLL